MVETEHLRWFEAFPRCSCGKPSNGILRGDTNQSYGHHCSKCANKRLKESNRVRLAKAVALAATKETTK